jgi:hypothetical protein
MSRLKAFAGIALVAVTVAACDQKSPTAASSVSGSGVTVAGSVLAPVPAGLQVTVGGSSNTAQVDSSGQFTLNNLASGTVDLRFEGSGVSASLVLTGLLANQKITLVLTVSGPSATIESQRRVRGSDEELEGRIESMAPPNTMVVAGRTVSTGSTTSFTTSGQIVTFNTLAVGQRVSVKGQGTSGALIAAKIDILTPVPVSGNTVFGVISGFSGTRSAFQFVVNGTAIQGDGQTVFDAGSQFCEMSDGLQIEVTGTPQSGPVYAARLVLVSPSTKLTGTITSRTGMSPQLVVTIAGRTVAVSALTEVRRKGNPQDARAIATGQTVDVSGRFRGDGVVAAGTIDILADAPGGGFWMEGTIGALSGTCPQLAMTVGGYAINADLQTVFVTPCDQLAVGDKIEIIGIVRPDLSVMVTNIKKI